jgi:hypothetical protein
MPISYDEYLTQTGKEDCKDSWIDWKTDIYGMNYTEALRAANDPDWGYEN